MKSLRACRARLLQLLFRPVNATPLALLRIGAGLITLLWSTALLSEVDPLFTWLRASPSGDIGWWQFWPRAPEEAVMVMGSVLVCTSILMTVGLWTRCTAVLTFFLVLTLQRYNPLALNGGDWILRGILLLPLALSPAGAYLSVDAWRANGGRLDWKAPLISPWPLRFVQAHISLGYILTVVLKLRGHSWIGGTAMWYAFGLDEYTRFDIPSWISAGTIGALISWLTLLVELAIGIGVWSRRARVWVLAAGVILHLSIAVVFEISIFSLVMLVSYLAFLPDVPDVRDLIPWRSRRGVATLETSA